MSCHKQHTFLAELAQQLIQQYGHDISTLTILLPSQRAKTFFLDEIKLTSDTPLWAPQFTTIDRLMSDISELHAADKVRLITELYTIYTKHHNETFDRFYHWGELLLADFDMIDKYKVDARQIFSNIHDIKELESDLSYLTPHQLEIIRKFWATIYGDKSPSEQRKRFLKMWNSLYDIYCEYRNHLRELKIGYIGMIHRDASDKIEAASDAIIPPSTYIVAGFNALSTCEHSLFKYLQSCHNAQFFWDYDDYYVSNNMQESGRFIRQNIKDFATSSTISHNNFCNIKQVDVVATTTAVAQCKYAVEILKQIATNKGVKISSLDKDTAIVLTDESLLIPLLYALPPEIGDVNVTMGYPYRTTAAASLIERLIALQSHARKKDDIHTFYHVDINRVLTHPYFNSLIKQSDRKNIIKNIANNHCYMTPQQSIVEWGRSDYLKLIFRCTDSSKEFLDYLLTLFDTLITTAEISDRNQKTFIETTIDEISKLKNVFESCRVELPITICYKLLRKHLQSIRIPYVGEPLKGLQIMGILETRNIDFENVLILSTSDSNFPGKHTVNASFIPYNLRYAHGLPTPEHHDSVYSYYFYRLIQRASHVWAMYSSHSEDGGGANEPSRYIRQLLFESGLNIKQTSLSTELIPLQTSQIVVAKDDNVMQRLMAYTDGRQELSPSSFSSFVKCPLRFYFSSIAHIRKEKELEENIDSSGVGKILHGAIELLYTDFVGVKNPKSQLMAAANESNLSAVAKQAILESGYIANSEGEFDGEMGIIHKIITSYLKHIVNYDINHCNFTIKELETDIKCTYPIMIEGKQHNIHIKGRADRIDILNDGTTRIIDYKTGDNKISIDSFDTLFNGAPDKREQNYINTLLYATIYQRSEGGRVQPGIYYTRKMNDKDYSELLILIKKGVEQYEDVRAEFEGQVTTQLEKLFNKNIAFEQEKDVNACQFCDFKPICQR